ncbi:MAG TPA: hypothetical protein VD931_15215 [Baekduia sp.]|nr:hypothetical protein [Baekduia sp.]
MTANVLLARQELQRLAVERREAIEAGLGANAAFLADIDADIDACRATFVGLAVTELASLRRELGSFGEG